MKYKKHCLEVIVRKGEPIDKAMKRLKVKVDCDGTLDEVRRLRSFETPGQKRRRKLKINARRNKLRKQYQSAPH